MRSNQGGNPEGKILLGRWEDNIKTDLKRGGLDISGSG